MTESVSFIGSTRYRLFWVSSLLSNIGTWMQQVAEPWVVLSLTSSSLWIGIDNVALNAPAWLFTLWGGVIADRMDRKRTILICQGLQLVGVALLFGLLFSGKLHMWEVIVVSLIAGTTDALSMPSFQSIIPSLVPAKDLPRAISLNTTQFNLSRIIGPALGGVLLARAGVTACFGANLLSYIPFFLSVAWIPSPNRGGSPSLPPESSPVRGPVADYLGLLRRPNVAVGLVVVFVLALACGPLISFVSVIIKSVFHAGARELGWSAASFGVGGVLGASSFPRWSKRVGDKTLFAIWATVLGGVATVLVPWAPSIIALDGLLVLCGAAMTLGNTAINTGLQEAADNSVRGRIVSLFQLTLHGGLSVGGLVTGLVASAYGIETALRCNGIVGVALAGTALVVAKRRSSGV